MPTTATAVVSVFVFVVVVVYPSGAASGRTVGQSLAECPTWRHAKHVMCSYRPAMRFNRRASVDAALSAAAAVSEVEWVLLSQIKINFVLFYKKPISRTFGPSGLFFSLWLWPTCKDLRSLLLGSRQARLVFATGDSHGSRVRLYLSLRVGFAFSAAFTVRLCWSINDGFKLRRGVRGAWHRC